MKLSSIRIIIPYFGQWPEWINLFFQSCRFNNTIHWLFFTDCGLPDIKPDNVEFVELSFNDYKKLVSQKLSINFHEKTPYKLCDLKPALGFIHQNYLTGYDFFGFGDVDVIYGNLRHFLTEELLTEHKLISTHDNRISGHFCLLRNTTQMRNAFRKIPQWQSHLENPAHLAIDESKFTKVFMPHRKHPDWLKMVYGWCNPYWRNNCFHEQYSTILSPVAWFGDSSEHPQEWLWKKGRLTNSTNRNIEFMYLHFMNWKSSKWLDKKYGHTASWEKLDTLVHFNSSIEQNQWTITPSGFHLLEDASS